MRALAMVLIAGTTACGDDTGSKQTDAAVVFEDAAVCVPGTQPLSTVFLSFNGETYMVGPEDGTMNKSNVLDMTRTLAPWPGGNAAAITSCITAGLKPFRIAVTDVDPGNAPHHEIVFTNVFWGNGGTMVGSVSASACSGITNSVTFVFATNGGFDAQTICDTALSQFATASAYLDHTTDCHDYLGFYNAPCGPRMWVDTPVPCGETTARACMCGGTTQASLRKMSEKYGASCAP